VNSSREADDLGSVKNMSLIVHGNQTIVTHCPQAIGQTFGRKLKQLRDSGDWIPQWTPEAKLNQYLLTGDSFFSYFSQMIN